MENFSILSLEAELKSFLKKEYRIDPTYRFCLIFSQLGDLYHYLTHDPSLNPQARSWGSKEDERGACAQALMQLLMTFNVINVPMLDLFSKVFKMKYSEFSTLNDVENNIKKILPKNLNSYELMNLIIKVNKYVIKLENNHSDFDEAIVSLKSLAIYITVRGFSFKEVLLMGLQNQRDRDWAKIVTEEIVDNKLFGLIGIPGMVTGKAYVVDENHLLADFPAGDILVTQNGKAEQYQEVTRASGVVTNDGGKTCHMVSVLLPLAKSIPCLVGTGFATKRIKHGQEVTIFAIEENGVKGYVQF